jgi:stearoyl-CoA desaturase (delta-9 desaturase)
MGKKLERTKSITVRWRNFLFFTITFSVCIIGVPIYIYNYGFHFIDFALFLFWVLATGLAITVGYHRLLAHRAFKAHPIVTFLTLFFGAAAFEESALQWTSQHRDHHKYVDTPRDPYNIKQGFFYAHIGWIIFHNHPIDYTNVRDLQQNKMILHQHQHYIWWAVGAGILLPLITGILWSNWLSALLIAVFGRITFVHHGTFFINSVCHYFGKAAYDPNCTAKDHWLVAFLTNGEGYHSFHHRFPSDYRNGHKWYHWDPSKWLIALMSKIGLTRDLKQVSKFQILAARIAAERAAVESYLSQHAHHDRLTALENLKTKYEQLKHMLYDWELRAKEYVALCSEAQAKSELVQSALKQVREARQTFLKMRTQWSRLIAKPAVVFSFDLA